MSLVSGLSAAKSGLELARGVYDLLGRRDYEPSEIQARLIELQSFILEAQRSLGEAEDENRQLQRRIESLQSQDAIQSSLLFAENVYLKRNAEGGLDGPFCACCWDIDRKLVHLIQRGERHWEERNERMLRFDCVVHAIPVFLRPEAFNPKIIR